MGGLGLIPGLGRSPGVGNGHLFRYSFLDNPMDRGAWLTTVYGAAESDTTELTLLVNQWESPAWSPRRHGCAGAKTGLVKGHGEGASKDHSGQGRRASPEMISHVLSRCWGWASGGVRRPGRARRMLGRAAAGSVGAPLAGFQDPFSHPNVPSLLLLSSCFHFGFSKAVWEFSVAAALSFVVSSHPLGLSSPPPSRSSSILKT